MYAYEGVKKKTNNTGVPDAKKTQFEKRSGFSFDDVKVHYNSDKPAQLQAVAYTQGNQVYIAPNQEKHLDHELTHVVQQKQGLVKPTKNLNGTLINDDPSLEQSADLGNITQLKKEIVDIRSKKNDGVVQRVIVKNPDIGLTTDYIEAIKEISPSIREIVKALEGKPDEVRFSSLEELTNRIMTERVHDTVSDFLGLPANNIIMDGYEIEKEIAVTKLLEALQTLRGIKGSEETEEEARIDFAIHRAAAGVVVGVGVCDNFASLSAVIMRIIGMEDIKLGGNLGHKYAKSKGMKVDPWTDYTHRASVEDDLSSDDRLDLEPNELERRFFEEIRICRDIFNQAYNTLSDEERQAYEDAKSKDTGTAVWRKERQAKRESAAAVLLAKKRQKQEMILKRK